MNKRDEMDGDDILRAAALILADRPASEASVAERELLDTVNRRSEGRLRYSIANLRAGKSTP